MGKLLDLNSDKFIKATLSYLLLDIIVREHDEFDEEKDLTNTEIKRFKYILDIQDDREIEDITGETQGFYGEYKDPDQDEPDEATLEQNYDDEEEMNALDLEYNDIDQGLDFEQDYLDLVNYNYVDTYIGIEDGDGNEFI